MKRIGDDVLDALIAQAQRSPRNRQHLNLHQAPSDACQRLLNAVLRHSYIRPHRHLSDPKNETLIALRGQFGAIAFDDDGSIANITLLCADGNGRAGSAAAVELSPEQWHTVVAMTDEAVLLEVKSGPFDPSAAKDLAEWAPVEGSGAAAEYLEALRGAIEARC